jgi:hypothetical protein
METHFVDDIKGIYILSHVKKCVYLGVGSTLLTWFYPLYPLICTMSNLCLGSIHLILTNLSTLPVIHSHFTGELGKCCSHREQPVRQPTDGALVGLWADLAWTQAKSFLKFILKLIVTLKTVILRVGVQGYPES